MGLRWFFFVASAFRPVWPGRCIWALSVYRSRLAPWTRGESNHGMLSALRPLGHGRYRFATASAILWVCDDECDFIRGTRLLNVTLKPRDIAISSVATLCLLSIWSVIDPILVQPDLCKAKYTVSRLSPQVPESSECLAPLNDRPYQCCSTPSNRFSRNGIFKTVASSTSNGLIQSSEVESCLAWIGNDNC